MQGLRMGFVCLLMVEATNFRPGMQGRGGTENMTVTERFACPLRQACEHES
jgi:hypothetical protein